ncbi:MAG: VOC family protein [Actinobacteria bacterium]|nr:VOC family protein [Actinomycetota bacterium]MBW3650432.1 VOC family protein [Actinomycetota bacterium]
MSRVQLALNVSDLDAAVDFYSRLFRTPPAKVRPGYANFAIADPPLKLVLIAGGAGPGGTLNHLGVEVGSPEDVADSRSHLGEAGLTTIVEDNVNCCYALQDKVWVDDPDGAPWEIYTVLADAEEPPGAALRSSEGAGCSVTPGAEVAHCC